ncbi:VOC family protein [uncultured Algimonas sp.]|uniref:VOC family protein n=1 Tax=uncultured Algimonas sp. TaxID=1547920 RepID=UPI00262FEC8C|nr:VOC family protein [uncultured Algimonas sp.]
MKVNSLYVTARDFERAKACYTDHIFQREHDSETDRFVFWDIDGFLFGIFNPNAIDVEVDFGDSTVPTIEVEDAAAAHVRLTKAGLESVMEPHDVNDTHVAQIRDTEGNVLEFYHWLKKAE